MAVRRLADEQPAEFNFTPENLEWAKAKVAEYPEGRGHSAVIPLLWRAQEQHDRWLPEPAIRYVADMIGMPYIRALEVATFYTMFQLGPVGRIAHIQVCGTTPCMLRGADDLIAICRKRIAAAPFTLSSDGAFSWEEVECAGACVNAPMVQVGADTFEDLTADTFVALLDGFAAGQPPAPGPQSGRRTSEPVGGLTSLTTDPEKLFAARVSEASEGNAAPDAGAPPAAEAAPSAGVDPETTAARGEDHGRPNGSDRTEVEQARSRPEDAPAEEPVAPSPQTSGTSEAAPDAPEKQKNALDSAAAERSGTVGAISPAAGGHEAAPAAAADGPTAAAGMPDEAAGRGPERASPSDMRERAAVERADRAGVRPDVAPDDGRDDLEQISGIGPVLKKRLYSLGIHRFEQIAGWSPENIEWIDSYLAFKGRIVREGWVEQARELAGRTDARNGT